MPGSGLCVICEHRTLHQELCEARCIQPGQRAPALFLDERAGVFGDADIAATDKLGDHSGLAAAGAAGNDVEECCLDVQREFIS